MAAMAQQDCGQCGYNCNDYADAIAARKEERLNLCAPGGKDTARMLKTLAEEFETAGAALASVPLAAPAVAQSSMAVAPGRSRDNPAFATFIGRRRLNKEGSEKETWHVEFDLSRSGLDYVVGNSSGSSPATNLASLTRSSPCSAPRISRRCAEKRCATCC